MSRYGKPPEVMVRKIHMSPGMEMMAYLYLPIKLPYGSIKLEPRLNFIRNIIYEVNNREDTSSRYIYTTVKNLFVTPDNPGNRPGWHSDGFLTDDINYIWCDRDPTIFCEQKFNIQNDHKVSMEQFIEQAKKENERTYVEGTLLRLDQFNIHRSPDITVPGMRMFIKISVSKHRYNLAGNSHNHLLDYNWRMYGRDSLRNHPIHEERDYYDE